MEHLSTTPSVSVTIGHDTRLYFALVGVGTRRGTGVRSANIQGKGKYSLTMTLLSHPSRVAEIGGAGQSANEYPL
jgi:hypothetical protein